MGARSHLVLLKLQVPPLKKSAVMISLVPEDVGKTAFKMEKVAVQDGTCLWERPIYVTVKLTRDSKTGKIHEKIYHFVVSSVCCSIISASLFISPFLSEPFFIGLPNSCGCCRDRQNQISSVKLQLILQILQQKLNH